MLQPTNPSHFGQLCCQLQSRAMRHLVKLTKKKKKKGHLWKMIIKILHFYILLTMKRDSVLINILTRLSYTDYTQQLF